MTIKHPDLLNKLGIGAFTFLSIVALSDLSKSIFENIFIISGTISKIVIWLPEIISLLIFLFSLIWILDSYKKIKSYNTRKIFIKAMVVFFGLTILQFLFSFFQSGFLLNEFPESFNQFLKLKNENYELYAIIGLFALLKYLIFGAVLILKK